MNALDEQPSLEAEIRRLNTELERQRVVQKVLEAKVIEAQKMDALGQLASGVAHDFNNILAVIMGYADMITSEVGAESPLRKYTAEIRRASESAAGLAQQLLVFSRKNTAPTAVLDPRAVVTDLAQMLRRLIGENIELKVVAAGPIGHIHAEPSQVCQVLMNLAVNARDAMPEGGTLAIEIKDVTLEAEAALTLAGATPGDYVRLSVSDTGTGMEEEVKAHMFEAFFTTKPRGKGTGLGLATCQMIVRQFGGHIGVESEAGRGTTFRLYFPRVEPALELAAAAAQPSSLARGTETLLFVEDEPAVRQMACGVLESLGYEVLPAANGQDALNVASAHQGAPIRLVVTDVIMPLMGGKLMAEWLKAVYPDLKVLFTSGYTEDMIHGPGAPRTSLEFLPKPYTTAALAGKVRELLERR